MSNNNHFQYNTTLIDEKWVMDFYFFAMEKKKKEGVESEIIERVLSLDRSQTSIVELLLIDPIYAPNLLKQWVCSNCNKKSYDILRVINIPGSVSFLCKDCVETLFVNPFKKVDNKKV